MHLEYNPCNTLDKKGSSTADIGPRFHSEGCTALMGNFLYTEMDAYC